MKWNQGQKFITKNMQMEDCIWLKMHASTGSIFDTFAPDSLGILAQNLPLDQIFDAL